MDDPQLNIGDPIPVSIPGHNVFIMCIITEMDGDRPCRFKAADPEEGLCLLGFVQEGEDFVLVEWDSEIFQPNEMPPAHSLN